VSDGEVRVCLARYLTHVGKAAKIGVLQRDGEEVEVLAKATDLPEDFDYEAREHHAVPLPVQRLELKFGEGYDAVLASPPLPGRAEAPLAIKRSAPPAPVSAAPFSSSELAVMKSSLADWDMSDAELQLFARVCESSGLNPWTREIWPLKIGDRLQCFVGIQGYRRVAQETGEYEGREVLYHADAEDVEGRTRWLLETPPHAVTVTVRRKGQAPVSETVILSKVRGKSPLWSRRPELMLVKQAEALALRAAFPERLQGTYVIEERWDEQ